MTKYSFAAIHVHACFICPCFVIKHMDLFDFSHAMDVALLV